jgi:hypothetical protein
MSEEWRFLLRFMGNMIFWGIMFWILTGAKLPGEKK